MPCHARGRNGSALHALLIKFMRPLGAAQGGTTRDLLKLFEQVVQRLEGDPSLTWEQALGISADVNDLSQQKNSNSKSQALKNFKL